MTGPSGHMIGTITASRRVLQWWCRPEDTDGRADRMTTVRMLAPADMTILFQAAAEATEEAVLNAMTSAETMVGQHGRIVHELPHDKLQEVMRRYRPVR